VCSFHLYLAPGLNAGIGDVVRFGPNRIAVNSNSALKDIYAVRANTQKSQYYSVFSHFFKVPMSMTTIDRKKHAFKRRVDSEALSANTIKSMEGLVLNNARMFCHYMVDEKSPGDWSDARDMTNWFGYLMFDIMGDIVFNQNWKMMSGEDNRPIIDTLAQGVSGLNLVSTPLFSGPKEQSYHQHSLATCLKFSPLSSTNLSSASSPQEPTNIKPLVNLN